jgi:5-methyltetrahydrofolate--homocysteine methyltransferase
MAHVASLMEKEGLALPLLIGGATTSENHTAVKIAPNYSGAVVHVRDASRGVGVCRKLMDLKSRADYIKEVHAKNAALRKSFEQDRSLRKLVPLVTARKGRFTCDWAKAPIKKPNFLGVKALKDFDIRHIRERIDWSFFFLAWNLKGRYPRILQHPEQGVEATKLFNDAQEMLDEIIAKKLLTCNGVVGLFPANSIGDDVEVYADASRKKTLTTFRFLRQQMQKSLAEEPFYCLADFVAPRGSDVKDYLGAFAVTGGLGTEAGVKYFKNDDYKATLLKTLADRLAEGFAEVLHETVRKEYWGYAPEENLTNEELFADKYKGIRPAPGYPACPDHTEKPALFKLLDATKNSNIFLTESHMMVPVASVCGYYFGHPDSTYFPITTIGPDQLADYAKRKDLSLAQAQKWLAPLL